MALEASRQHVLAARVERECRVLKEAWDEAAANGYVLTTKLSDAAEELRATLAALARFKQHLAGFTSPMSTRSRENNGSCLDEKVKPPRRKGRRLETHLRLKALLVNRAHQFWGLANRIMKHDPVALDEFKDTFGPKALATRWAAEEGEPPDGREINRWNTAIKESCLYKQMIRPVTSNPPELPVGWQQHSLDEHLWDDVL
ncbi:MAG: hypothetical protein H8E66_34730 [Planctomycetes bacterium]|nr:hypothetical protein [Planctomycetota bacterium]